jgi:TRAP-type C4-dicarboxylate transport system permease small subunit
MKKVLYFLDKQLEEFLTAVIMAYFVFASVTQIFCRFILQSSVAWTDETARYSFIWMVFIGAAAAVKNRSHIRVDFLESLIKNPGAKIMISRLCQIVFLIFALCAMALGIKICASPSVQTSPVLQIPFVYIYLALPVGMGLMSFRLLQSLYRDIRGKQPEKEV